MSRQNGQPKYLAKKCCFSATLCGATPYTLAGELCGKKATVTVAFLQHDSKDLTNRMT